jgi:hypothetical protein
MLFNLMTRKILIKDVFFIENKLEIQCHSLIIIDDDFLNIIGRRWTNIILIVNYIKTDE